MSPTPHARTGESFPHPVRSYEMGGDESTLSKGPKSNRRLRVCTYPRGIRFRAMAIDVFAGRILAPVRPSRDRLGEPLDVRNIIRVRGPGIAGI